jgi:D-3-phosphoglycerate dehydrogenase
MGFKVLITDGLEKEGIDIINATGEAVNKKGIEPDELLQIIGEYDGLIVRGRTKVTREVFEAAKNLKVVGRAGVGVDNIDLQAAKDHGVTVVNAPVATTIAVAELGFGMMLALVRDIPHTDAEMKHDKWTKKDYKGHELHGKTLGIVGYGNIGSTIGKYAQALGMKVLCYDPIRNIDEMRATGADPVQLEDIYAKSDIITFHVPLIPETKHMVNDETFTKMKDGVLLVNVARGGIIEEAALLRALESGKVAGAALDVYEKEPPVDWTIAEHPKVIAVPHVGGQTEEAQLRVAGDIASEVMNVLQGNKVRWKIC